MVLSEFSLKGKSMRVGAVFLLVVLISVVVVSGSKCGGGGAAPSCRKFFSF